MSALGGGGTVHPATCRWFWAWSAVGALCAFGLLAILSIGLPFLLIGVAAIPLLLTRASLRGSSTWAAAGLPGLISGIGLTLLLIAFLHRDDQTCASGSSGASGTTVHAVGPALAGESVSCGGTGPEGWLVWGLAFVLAGALVFAAIRALMARTELR